jgi:hypothetical protein
MRNLRFVSRADFLHSDFLEPDALKAGACKRHQRPLPKKHRHDVHMKLVDESRVQELLVTPPATRTAFSWAIADSTPSAT